LGLIKILKKKRHFGRQRDFKGEHKSMTLSEFKNIIAKLPEGDQEVEVEFNYKDRDGFTCTSWRKNFKVELEDGDKIVISNS